MKKRLIGVAVLAALVLSVLPWAAAQNSYSMTIVHQWEEQPLPDVSFSVYQVADPAGTRTESFQGCTVELTELEKKTASELDKMAKELLEYSQEHDSQPTQTQTTDTQGVAVFAGLEEGLYLIVGDTLTQEKVQYEVSPFLLLLTQDITSYTKAAVVESPPHEEDKPGDNTNSSTSTDDNNKGGGDKPTQTDKNTSSNNSEKNNDSDSNQTGTSQTSGGKLPQTGQIWWPVPVMACGGILLFSCGWWIEYGKEEEKE
jgi:hypothetical protein